MPGLPTPPFRLAVETVLHEEDDRRAMEGDLRLLERAWEEGEQIAAVSDDLLLPYWAWKGFEKPKE